MHLLNFDIDLCGSSNDEQIVGANVSEECNRLARNKYSGSRKHDLNLSRCSLGPMMVFFKAWSYEADSL